MNTNVPAEQFLSSSDYLSVIRDFALSKGISLHTLLHDSELSAEQFINPPKLVNNFIVTRIGINLVNELKNPLADAADFGLCMTASSHGPLGIAVQCAANLKEAYEILTTFYNTRINSQDLRTVYENRSTKVFLENKYEMTLDNSLQRFFDFATLVSVATNTYHALHTDHLKGEISIHIDAPEPEDFPYHKFEGIRFEFGQTQLAMFIPISWQRATLAISNPDIAKAAVEQCEDEMKLLIPKDFTSKVRAYLQEDPSHISTLNDAAAIFYMSPATFKRKLKEEGTNYQGLKDEVRMETAKKLILANKMNLEDISAQLGFSDASNFSKSFKSWAGCTPGQYRQNKTQDSGS